MRACCLGFGCMQLLSVKSGMRAPFMFTCLLYGFRCFAVCWFCILPGYSPLKTNPPKPGLFLSWLISLYWHTVKLHNHCTDTTERASDTGKGLRTSGQSSRETGTLGGSFTAESVYCEIDSLMSSFLPVSLAVLSSHRVFPGLYKPSQLVSV